MFGSGRYCVITEKGVEQVFHTVDMKRYIGPLDRDSPPSPLLHKCLIRGRLTRMGSRINFKACPKREEGGIALAS